VYSGNFDFIILLIDILLLHTSNLDVVSFFADSSFNDIEYLVIFNVL